MAKIVFKKTQGHDDRKSNFIFINIFHLDVDTNAIPKVMLNQSLLPLKNVSYFYSNTMH